jgi:hypothetical protein
MSTTEVIESASAGAAEATSQSETVQPEQQTAGDAHQQTEAEEGSDQSSDEGGGDKLTPEQRTIKKLESRIARLTGKRGAAEREVALLRQELAQVRGSGDGQAGQDGEPKFSEAEIERIADRKAKEIASRQSLAQTASKVIEEGQKLEGFKEAVDALAEVIPFTDEKGNATPFIKAVFRTPVAASLLKYLGENPDEAEDLIALDPVEQGWRFAELSQKLKQAAVKKTSAAPQPIRPVGGTASSSAEPDPDKDPAAWIAARNRAAVRGL